MGKFGGVVGTVNDSKILELANGLTPDMEGRFGANVDLEELPGSKDGQSSNLTNFAVRWSNSEGQEVVGIFTRTVSTFTGEPIVRLQLASNGKLPNKEMIKEVMASLLVTGSNEIKDRGWGLPIGTKVPPFGGPVPVVRIHAHKEPEIVTALQEMGAGDRECGSKTMVAAIMASENIPDAQKVFGISLPFARAEKAIINRSSLPLHL